MTLNKIGQDQKTEISPFEENFTTSANYRFLE